ncbi:MAG: hypothetical protein FWF52_00915 [Candidatus Azobacteroides sp.]|nr:hypothetical protein [Candidatus Azobacteroides sp.]
MIFPRPTMLLNSAAQFPETHVFVFLTRYSSAGLPGLSQTIAVPLLLEYH